MSDTLETKKQLAKTQGLFRATAEANGFADFARNLERQRNMLLEVLERLANHGHADDCLFLNRAGASCDCGNDEAFRLIASVKQVSPCVGKP